MGHLLLPAVQLNSPTVSVAVDNRSSAAFPYSRPVYFSLFRLNPARLARPAN